MYCSSSKSANFQSKVNLDKKDDKPCIISSKGGTTPVGTRRSLADEECLSPLQIRCTQDGGDDEIDVVWDWQSPQARSKKINTRQRKRPLITISPQIPRKVQSKSNLISKFSSLKAELDKLNTVDEQSIVSKNDTLVNLSDEYDDCFIEEHGIKDPSNVITEQLEASDLFGDDSFDEEMIKCSQQIEEAFVKPQHKTIEILLNNHSATNIADDSFDALLEEFTDEDIVRLSQDPCETIQHSTSVTPVKNVCSSRTIYRTHSTPVRSERLAVSSNNISPARSNRLDGFPRTKSANDCNNLPSPPSPVMTCSPEEIEKKRNQAKARLELRTEKEIEKKRLEALERLKKNRMQRNAKSFNSR